MSDRSVFPTTVHRYIIKEFLIYFAVCFLFFFFIFVLNYVLLIAEQVLAKKAPVFDVLLLILFSLPSIIALSFPFGTLVGCLMTVGKLSASNEIIAFQAAGIRLRSVFLPLIFMGVLFSGLSFLTNDVLLPIGAINYGKIYRNILYSNPEIEIEPYAIKEYRNSILVTGAVEGRTISNITILDRDYTNGEQFIVARQALVKRLYEGVISLELEDVFTHKVERENKEKQTYSWAKKMTYNLLLKNMNPIMWNPSPREMSSVDVWEQILEKRRLLENSRRSHQARFLSAYLRARESWRAATSDQIAGVKSANDMVMAMEPQLANLQRELDNYPQDQNLQNFMVEFNKKFAIPFACFPFMLIALPLGLLAKKSGRLMGFGLGILIAFFYWASLLIGQTLATKSGMDPFWTIWAANLIMLFFGVIATVRRLRQ